MEKFLFKYGINTTTNFDLEDIAKDLGIKIKVLMRNELKNLEDFKTKNLVINLDSSENKGSHWVCLYKNKYYFDPYGVLPINTIDQIDGLVYNTLQIQPDDTKMCGKLCLYVLDNLEKGEKFEDVVLCMYEEMEDILNP
jgi:hypothetical protein